MIEIVPCPVKECPFEASIGDVISHVRRSNDEQHDWEQLGFENYTDFRRESHCELGERLLEKGREAHDFGQFDKAIQRLESAQAHFRRENWFSPGGTPSSSGRLEQIEDEIAATEEAQQTLAIDETLDRAENVIDSALGVGGQDSENRFQDARDLLRSAESLAEETVPDRIARIERLRLKIKIERVATEFSESNQGVKQLLKKALRSREAALRAFQEQDYQTALDHNETAREGLAELTESILEVGDQQATNEKCTICGRKAGDDENLFSVSVDRSSTVCMKCIGMSTDETFSKIENVETELDYIEEEIEELRDKSPGADWLDVDNPPTTGSTDEESQGCNPKRQQMIMQLNGIRTKLRRDPTAADLDEHTEFKYLEYREEFGGIAEALREAGFDR